MRRRKRRPATLYGLEKYPASYPQYDMMSFDRAVTRGDAHIYGEEYWRNDPTYFAPNKRRVRPEDRTRR